MKQPKYFNFCFLKRKFVLKNNNNKKRKCMCVLYFFFYYILGGVYITQLVFLFCLQKLPNKRSLQNYSNTKEKKMKNKDNKTDYI